MATPMMIEIMKEYISSKGNLADECMKSIPIKHYGIHQAKE